MQERTVFYFIFYYLVLVACSPQEVSEEIPRALNELGDVLKLGHSFGGLISRKQEPEFRQYVEKWTELTGKPPKFGIRFTQQTEGWLRGSDDRRVGYCILYPNGQKEVRIERDQWEKYEIPLAPQSPYNLYQELVLFHELGHCDLGKTHSNALVGAPDNPTVVIPESLMHPKEDEVVRHYKQYREFYLKNLMNE